MAQTIKQWEDGTNLSVTYEGSGDGEAIFTSDTNEGIDREMSVTFEGGGISVERQVTQEGLRQRFITADGKVFCISGGGRFAVLKEGGIEPPIPEEPSGIDINNYLTIEARADGLTAELAVDDVEYCVDGDGNWKSLLAGTATEAINTGQTLSFRAQLTGYSTYRRFTISKSCNVSGDPMSLYAGDNAATTTAYKYNYTFAYLFYNCTTLVDASKLNLSRTPRSYSCYYMFYGCKALTAPPDLPATTIASSCYRRMFQGCTAMTKSPDLPALELYSNCYEYMFVSCSKLASIKMLATDVSASNCLLGWVNAIKSSGTFYKNKDATWTNTGISGVPSGWTVILI